MKYEGQKKPATKKPATKTTIFCYVISYFEKGINTVKYRVIAMLVAEVALVLVTPYIYFYIMLFWSGLGNFLT